MVVLVADQDALARPSHAVGLVVFFQTLEASEHGGVFFRLGLFGAEGVVGEGVEADCLGLVGVEGFREDGGVGGLEGWGRDCGHVCDTGALN